MLRRALFLLLLACSCRPLASTGPDDAMLQRCSAKVKCNTDLVLFIVPRPFTPETSHAQRKALQTWLAVNPTLLTVVYLVTEPTAAAAAAEHRIPCLRLLPTPTGVPYFNAALAAAGGACGQVRALTYGDVALANSSAFLATTDALLDFDWKQQLVATADPFRRYRREERRTGGWLGVGGTGGGTARVCAAPPPPPALHLSCPMSGHAALQLPSPTGVGCVPRGQILLNKLRTKIFVHNSLFVRHIFAISLEHQRPKNSATCH